MIRPFCLIIAISAVSSLTACRSGSICCTPGFWPRPCVADSFETTQARDFQLNGLPSSAELDALLTPLEVPNDYLLLDPGMCLCTAAAESKAANLIQQEVGLIEERLADSHGRHRNPLIMQRDLLWHRSEEKRNEDASAAMVAFYQLAEVEILDRIATKSMAELDLMLSRARELKTVTEVPELDVPKLESQRHQLQSDALALAQQRLRLNGQLQLVLGCGVMRERYFWPDIDWNIEPRPIDLEVETAIALETRSNLQATRLVLMGLERSTLPVARAVLQVAEASLGSSPRFRPLNILLLSGNHSAEIAVREEQLMQLTYHTEQLIAGTVADAALAVEVAQRHVALANENRNRLSARVDQLTRELRIERANSFEVSAARLELFKAESVLFQRLSLYRQAEVKLSEVKGVLAGACVYDQLVPTEAEVDFDES